jgi:tetratricopeptide (TPR) repeat protein
MTIDKNITNAILRWAIWVGLFAVPFVLFIVSGTTLSFGAKISTIFPQMLFPFITGKNFWFRIIVEIVFALWIILALRDERYAPKKSWIAGGMLTFLGVLFIADLFSANPYKSFWSNFERMEGFIGIAHLVAYFFTAGTMLAAHWIQKKGEALAHNVWDWFFHISIGASLFMSLYTWLQVAGEIPIDQGRPDGTLGNPTYLAVYLLFHVFFIVFYLVSRKPKVTKLIWSYLVGTTLFVPFYLAHISAQTVHAGNLGVALSVVSAFIAIAAATLLWTEWGKEYLAALPHKRVLSMNGDFVFALAGYGFLLALESIILSLTETRGAELALAFGALLIAVVFIIRKETEKPLRILAGIVIGVVVVSCGFLFIARNAHFVENNSTLSRYSQLVSGVILHPTQYLFDQGKSRVDVWTMAWQGVKERPLLGWGQESFNYLFYKYYNPNMYDQESWFDRAHDFVFDWLTSAGFIGLLAYLSLFAAAFWYLWCKRNRGSAGDLSFNERLVITALLIAYMIHNVFVFDQIGSYIFFFGLLAYLHSVYGKPLSDSTLKGLERSGKEYGSVVIVAVAVLLIGGLYYFNYKPMVASSTLVSAMQSNSIDDKVSLYNDVFNADTIGNYEAREFLTQDAVAVAQSNLSGEMKQKIYDLAYAQLSQQIKDTPDDARYYYFFGTLLDAYGHYTDALPIWQKAVSISPAKQLLLLSLGNVYEATGDQTDALAQFSKAYNEAPQYIDAALSYFAASKQYDKLIPLWLQKIASDPNNFYYHISLAAAYAESGDRKDAVTELQNAATIEPAFASQAATYIQELKAGKPLQ